jgi:hypothetical protein
MAKTIHVVLIAIGIVLGLIVGIVALGYVWWRHNGAAMVQQAQQTYREGQAIGRAITTAACIDTVFARHASDHSASLLHQVNEQMFFDGCLRWSRATPGLCDTIPSGHGVKDLLRFATWSVDQCRRRGLQDAQCPNVVKPLERYCEVRVASQAR